MRIKEDLCHLSLLKCLRDKPPRCIHQDVPSVESRIFENGQLFDIETGEIESKRSNELTEKLTNDKKTTPEDYKKATKGG